MLTCVKCFASLECEKNEVLVAHGRYHVQLADLWKCPQCGHEILTGAGEPVHCDLAEEYYDRVVGSDMTLYAIVKKLIITGTDGPKEITVIGN